MNTYESALRTAGTASGLGLGQALSAVGGAMSAPRRMLWNALGWGDDARSFANYYGMDPDSLPGMLAGNAAEMLIDPINLLGPLAGRAAGALGKGFDAAKGLATREAMLGGEMASLAGEKAALGELGGIAKGAVEAPQAFKNWPPPDSSLWKMPADLDQMVNINVPDVNKVYNRVTPDALAALEKSGMGVGRQGGAGGALLTMDTRPPFIKGKGGVMGVDPLYRVPEYGATFSPPGSVSALMGERAGGLAERLGGSAGLIDAPMGEVGDLVGSRIGRIDPQIEHLGNLLAETQSAPRPFIPFQIGANPRISEDLANKLANIHAGGLSAAMLPMLMRPLPGDEDPYAGV